MSKFVSITPPFVRSPYNYDTKAASDESALLCSEPSAAQQNFKEECDINFIVDRFLRTGRLPEGSSVPQFGDFTGISDYHSALNIVRSSDAAFMTLPANVRSRFGNDPGRLLEFIGDDSNYDEAVKLGLVPVKDLSPDGARLQEAGAPTGGKSGGKAKPALRASNESLEGDGGEE